MITSNIIFEGYSYEIGRKYIWAKSYEQGKPNCKQILTPEGKELAKWIAENTEEGDIRRLKLMGTIWHNPEYSK